jgi:hypothetical protein
MTVFYQVFLDKLHCSSISHGEITLVLNIRIKQSNFFCRPFTQNFFIILICVNASGNVVNKGRWFKLSINTFTDFKHCRIGCYILIIWLINRNTIRCYFNDSLLDIRSAHTITQMRFNNFIQLVWVYFSSFARPFEDFNDFLHVKFLTNT